MLRVYVRPSRPQTVGAAELRQAIASAYLVYYIFQTLDSLNSTQIFLRDSSGSITPFAYTPDQTGIQSRRYRTMVVAGCEPGNWKQMGTYAFSSSPIIITP
jgi:hypothetical protein